MDIQGFPSVEKVDNNFVLFHTGPLPQHSAPSLPLTDERAALEDEAQVSGLKAEEYGFHCLRISSLVGQRALSLVPSSPAPSREQNSHTHWLQEDAMSVLRREIGGKYALVKVLLDSLDDFQGQVGPLPYPSGQW